MSDSVCQCTGVPPVPPSPWYTPYINSIYFQRFTINFVDFDIDCGDTFGLYTRDFHDCSEFCHETCSIQPNFQWNTYGNQLLIYFRSYAQRTNRRGFRIEYQVIGGAPVTNRPTSTTTPTPTSTTTTTTTTPRPAPSTSTPRPPPVTTTPTPSASGCSQIDPNALEGVIESPNYPGSYPPNLSCSWTIVGRVRLLGVTQGWF